MAAACALSELREVHDRLVDRLRAVVAREGDPPARETQELDETAHSASRGDNAGLAVDE